MTILGKIPFGRGLISTAGQSPIMLVDKRTLVSDTPAPLRLLVNRTGGAGGFSSSLDIATYTLH